MEPNDGDAVLDLPSRADFDAWLEAQPAATRAVWVRTAKKSSTLESITEDEMVDVGLCHGWVSAVRRRCDEDTYLQRYTRRTRTSKWSRINIAKVEQLTAAGLMRPGGLAEVAAAKSDGRWENPWT
ncbi:uncharacterized protein YdeI (YjbR/CyaY-like superfamily) [Nocardioides daedukensis]|uniref:Uncharacterized protein YdeI (YjbR/CyaY-like superfamily) n=1 Tax=Nocardioides daedukensis TaxID=634462 RepID=A0A7Y9UVL2_9ACTN|nr:hypothetical protein [Nocardioides daedukensis]NYG57780.1 uncharacterized protein YdeI (YjbR/CyaY-like superfamily) [Nocardioides daedukensis]